MRREFAAPLVIATAFLLLPTNSTPLAAMASTGAAHGTASTAGTVPFREGLAEPAAAEGDGPTVKVATVHFAPVEGNVAANRSTMTSLATTAAESGAKIIVLPEMATSGYSFFSRAEIARVAEQIPGPTTSAMGAIADTHDAYIAFGMPQYLPKKNLYYNVAVLMNPDGAIEGIYRKRNHLIESAYNALEYSPVPTFDTEYGRLALVICSDMFYSQFPRAAAVQGANILLAPANVGVDTSFVQLRTYENDFAMVVSNRYGEGASGESPEAFTQETFTIPSSYPYNFNYGSRSLIVDHDGTVLADHDAQSQAIRYGNVQVRHERRLPVIRRPRMYSLLAQDTLEPYTQTQFGQPAASTFAAAALDPEPGTDPWAAASAAITAAADQAEQNNQDLRLAVLPGDYFAAEAPAGIAHLKATAEAERVDILASFAQSSTTAPRSVLLGADGKRFEYVRTHRRRGDSVRRTTLGSEYWVVDREYARVALVHDVDMLPPETSHVFARMGVDVVAVNANLNSPMLSPLWQSRSADYLHLVVANGSGPEGIYNGGYQVDPGYLEGDGMVVREIDTAHVRKKPTARFFNFDSILQPCRTALRNC